MRDRDRGQREHKASAPLRPASLPPPVSAADHPDMPRCVRCHGRCLNPSVTESFADLVRHRWAVLTAQHGFAVVSEDQRQVVSGWGRAAHRCRARPSSRGSSGRRSIPMDVRGGRAGRTRGWSAQRHFPVSSNSPCRRCTPTQRCCGVTLSSTTLSPNERRRTLNSGLRTTRAQDRGQASPTCRSPSTHSSAATRASDRPLS